MSARQPSKRPTIHHVAHRAGVSPKTVSRVLNNEAHVTETTAARVRTAIAELGFIPNPAARALRSLKERMANVTVEYWAMYETRDGEARKWMAFGDRETAEGSFEDIVRSVQAVRVGIRVVEVTQVVVEETTWADEESVRDRLVERRERRARRNPPRA